MLSYESASLGAFSSKWLKQSGYIITAHTPGEETTEVTSGSPHVLGISAAPEDLGSQQSQMSAQGI